MEFEPAFAGDVALGRNVQADGVILGGVNETDGPNVFARCYIAHVEIEVIGRGFALNPLVEARFLVNIDLDGLLGRLVKKRESDFVFLIPLRDVGGAVTPAEVAPTVGD